MTSSSLANPRSTRCLAAGWRAVFAAAIGAAVVSVPASLAWLYTQTGVGRIEALGGWSLVRRGLDLLPLDPGAAGALFERPFDLHHAPDAIHFLALGLLSTMLLFAVLGTIVGLIPAVRRGGRRAAVLVAAFFTLPAAAQPLAALAGRLPAIGAVCGALLVTALWLGASYALAALGRRVAWRAQTGAAGGLLAVLLIAVAAVRLLAASSSAGTGAPSRPNILLISIDTLRPDHLGAYGYHRATSPAIDSIAEEGVVFEAAASPSTWTLPAHVTLLTGMPPERHGATTETARLDHRATTLAEVLRKHGYQTAAFVSGPFLRAEYGHAQGFDHYDDYTTVADGRRASHRTISSPELARLVSDWLRRRRHSATARPFFVFLHMWDVHYDFIPPPPYDTLFDPDYDGDLTGEGFESSPRVHAGMPARDLEHLIALYDGEIRFTDDHIGRIISLLKTLDLYDETITMVTSDHGEEFFEHGEKGHGWSLFEETLLVPLIVRYPPALPRGGRVTSPVSLRDAAPSLLHLAGIAEPGLGAGDGPYPPRDLISLARGAAPPSPKATTFAHLDFRGRRLEAARSEHLKLVRSSGGSDPGLLFDLLEDPQETRDLTALAPDAAASLRAELDAWRDHWSAAESLSAPLAVDSAQEERLRSLGYVE